MEVTRDYKMGQHCEDLDRLLLETGLGTKPPEGPVGPRIPEGLVPCRERVIWPFLCQTVLCWEGQLSAHLPLTVKGLPRAGV